MPLFPEKSLLPLFIVLLTGCSLLESKKEQSLRHHSGIEIKLPVFEGDTREVSRLLNLPYLKDYIENNRDEIDEILKRKEYKNLEHKLKSRAACEATRLLIKPLKNPTLFSMNSQGKCLPVSVTEKQAQSYFTDQQCTQSIHYTPESYRTFCNEILGTTQGHVLGDAAQWQPVQTIADTAASNWSLPYGTQLDVSLVNKKENQNPFMLRLKYKTVGKCQLEMRVYSQSPHTQELKPLLAIHGGSWKYRGLGYSALESEISHLTRRGFLVFTPFYRLSGAHDGPKPCQNAKWSEIISDVEDALQWVVKNGHLLGTSKTTGVSLFGQSAGSHLSGWLMSYHREQIRKVMLYYAPTDLNYFYQQTTPAGRYANYMESLPILKGFLGTDSQGVIPQSVLDMNAFPEMVDGLSPPVYLIHGDSDQVIPSDQSQRLCNAYNPQQTQITLKPGSCLERFQGSRFRCGDRGELIRIDKADHMLDLLCLPDIKCPAGGLLPAWAVENAMVRGYEWLNSEDF